MYAVQLVINVNVQAEPSRVDQVVDDITSYLEAMTDRSDIFSVDVDRLNVEEEDR